MTFEEAAKTILPDLKHRARQQLNEQGYEYVSTKDGFADYDVSVSLGDWNSVERAYGPEVADALFHSFSNF